MSKLDKKANQNWVTNHLDVSDRLFLVHIGYSLVSCILGAIWPAGAEFVVRLVYPVTALVTYFHPGIAHLYRGTLSPDFYTGLTCEALFSSVVTTMLIAIVFIARYYNQPWRFVEAAIERAGKPMAVVAILGSSLIVPLGSLIGAGFFGFENAIHFFLPTYQPIFERAEGMSQMFVIMLMAYSGIFLSIGGLAAPLSFIALALRFVARAISTVRN